MSSLTSGIALAPISVDIRANIGDFKTDMHEVSSIGVTSAASLSKSFTQAAKVGSTLSSMGSTLTKNVTVPIAGAGVACTGMAMQFDTSFAKVSTLLDKGTVNYDKYKQSILENSSKMNVAVDEYSDAVYQSISASVDQSKAIGFTNDAIKLAKGGFTDATHAVDLLTTIINAYSMSADDATKVSDRLVTTQNLGKTTVNELASNMGKVIPSANAFGVSLDIVCTSLADLTKNGINTAEATTYLNGMINELGKSGTTASDTLKAKTGKTFTELMKSGVGLTDCLKILKDAAKENGVQLSDMFQRVDAGKAALTIMKDDGVDFNNILNQMSNSAGATDTAFAKMGDTAEARLKKQLNKLKNEGIELGEKLIPLVEKGIAFISDLTEKFNSLTDKQQQNIISWAGMAAIAGPALKILGGGISTVSTLGNKLISLGTAAKTTATATSALGTASKVAAGTSGIGALGSGLGAVMSVAAPVALALGAVAATAYALHENSEYMNTSLNTTAEELPLLQKAFNNLDGGIVKTKEEMEELGLRHHEWSSNVAPETQEAIDNTATAWQNLNLEMDRVKTNNISLDSGIASNLQSQTESICNTIVGQIKDKQSEATKSLSEYFNVDKSLDTYEQSILSFFDSSSAEQIRKVTECKDRINEIYRKASDEHRELKEAEYAAIDKLQQDMADAQSRALASNQQEQTELLANFNVKMRTMDLEDTSELMQEKAKKRNEDIASTTEYYDTKIEMLEMNMNNMNDTQRIAAQEEIRKLQDEKEQKLGVVNDTYNQYLNTLKEKYPEIYAEIDIATGEILTVEQKKDRQRVEQAISTYGDLSRITESGMKHIYNTQSQAYEDVYFMVDEKTGQITGTWNMTTQEITGNSEDIRKQLMLIAQEHNGLAGTSKADMELMVNSNDTYANSTKNTALNVISMLQGTGHEVNGLYTEVINCNGTPVQVQVNKDGTIANLNEIESKLKETTANRWMTIWVTYKNTETGETWHGYSGTSNGYGYDADGNPISHGHYNGLDNVPYDGYLARLHKNERVLTAKENEAYTEGLHGSGNSRSTTINFNGNYNFNSRDDIDYMLNQAAIKFKGARG